MAEGALEDELSVMERDAADQDIQGMLRVEKDPYDEMDWENHQQHFSQICISLAYMEISDFVLLFHFKRSFKSLFSFGHFLLYHNQCE